MGTVAACSRASHPVDVERKADVLGPMLAAVDIGIVVAQPGHVAHRARDGDAARLRQHLDAFGQVDAIAEDVVTRLVDDDLAEMDADAEHQPLVLVDRLVEPRHALLDLDRRLDGGGRRAELGEHGIARAVDQRTAAIFDGRLPDLVARRPKMLERQLFLALHQPDEAGQVGMQDGRQSPFGTWHGFRRRKSETLFVQRAD